jgi:hypothetical protein|tara:strand:- start:1818 stop:3572 length:1755 start_codon:yes stop_codon:yes gene_type:complete
MKVIEKIIKYDDYNYVEGILQFKAYGRKTKDLLHSEYFSIDNISSVRLEIEQKYLSPQLPPGINKNKVSTLALPDKIPTIIDGDYSKPFGIIYDEIIVDDAYVDSNHNIIGPRFNSTKNGSDLNSTIEIKVYGLIKIAKERVETEIQFEITTIAHGNGRIEVHPLKDSYQPGDVVTIKAVPEMNGGFNSWRDNYTIYPQKFDLTIANEDITIEADFKTEIKPSSFKGSNLERGKNFWESTSFTNRSLGVEAIGCWEILGYVFSALFYGAILILLLLLFGRVLLVLAVIGLFIWLLSLIPIRIFSWRILQWIIGLGFLILLLNGGANFVQSFNTYRSNHVKEKIKTGIPTKEIENENTTIDYVHHVKWKDYDSIPYEIDLVINSDLVKNATNYKNSQPNITSEASYTNLLSNLYHKSKKDDYVRVLQKLDSIRLTNNIEKTHFSEVMVSMVQTIPYYAIVEKSCNPFSYQDPMIRELLLKKPCEPNIRHGIKAPAEFLMNLKGDCDSRTIFLYGLLKSRGYDVVIFGSQKYKHSVLGIALSSDMPHFKIINNKKYYLWEVTGKNYIPGKLPTQISDLNYWELNLN